MSIYRTYPPGAFDKTEAAYYLGISPRSLDEVQRGGHLIPKKHGTKRLFLKADLDEYLGSLDDWNDAA